MHQVTFKLTKDNGLEYPARFKGSEVTYDLPDTLEEFRTTRVDTAVATDEEKFGKLVAERINGQGTSLTIQKAVKDFLASAKVEGKAAEGDTPAVEALSIEDALRAATDFAAAFRFGAAREAGTGKPNGKVKAAEAARDAAVEEALELYTMMPKNLRAKARERMLAKGTATAEQLDAIDNA